MFILELVKLELGPLGTNCYILYDQSYNALIFDPGGDSTKLQDLIEKKHLKPIAILLTHAHFDHIGAVDDIRDRYNIPVYLHESEKEWLMDAQLNGSARFPVTEVSTHPSDKYLTPGKLELASFEVEVRHTPGHSPGGVAFVLHKGKIVIGGDSLFQNGIGRTDLYGGNMEQLINSIREQFLTLDNDYTVYPGHGPETTIKCERENNPFLK